MTDEQHPEETDLEVVPVLDSPDDYPQNKHWLHTGETSGADDDGEQRAE